jgi:hypothetical protein
MFMSDGAIMSKSSPSHTRSARLIRSPLRVPVGNVPGMQSNPGSEAKSGAASPSVVVKTRIVGSARLPVRIAPFSIRRMMSPA